MSPQGGNDFRDGSARAILHPKAPLVPTVKSGRLTKGEKLEAWMLEATENEQWCRVFLTALELHGYRYEFDVMKVEHEVLKQAVLKILMAELFCADTRH